MKNETKVLLGIAGAALAGAVIGMLVAPEKGCDTRKKIKETASDWADRVRHLAGKANHKAKSMAHDAAAAAEDVIGDIENKAAKVRNTVS